MKKKKSTTKKQEKTEWKWGMKWKRKWIIQSTENIDVCLQQVENKCIHSQTSIP